MLPELQLRISSRTLPAQEWDSGCPCFSSAPFLDPVGPETCVCACVCMGVCVRACVRACVCVCASRAAMGTPGESLSFLSGAASWASGRTDTLQEVGGGEICASQARGFVQL